MGRTIDERVVEMRFDNQNFEKNINTSMSSLDKLKEKLNFKGASDSFEKLGKAAGNVDMSPLGRSIDDIKNKFSMLEAIAVGGMMRIGQKAADTGIQLAKSLSVDQIAAGWDKFAQKTTSVATLISQGYDMSEVEEQLSRLNWFTDETSYNFTDMVANIAKFTATGKSLNDSVTAMEGIANWAALSGQNAATASHAMYQLSQAMGAGVMRREDYRSIQNASMDTDEFRQICLDTAVALGTLRDNADGTYSSLMTAGKGAEAFTKAQFTTKLTEGGWLTGDVMMAVFNKYSSAVSQIYEYAEEKGITASEAIEELDGKVDEFGLKAFLAAQEAKTFGDAIDSVKDAVSTGWMNTFELIFGNYEKQRVLWTELANRMYDVFASSGEIRNEILQQWNDLGGQDKLVETFWILWDKIAAVVQPIKDAFREIFPHKTGQELYLLTVKLKTFINNLKLSEETLENFKMTFKGAFAAVDIVYQVLKRLGSIVTSIAGKFKPVGGWILKITGAIGEFLIYIDEGLKKGKKFNDFLDHFREALDWIGQGIGAVGKYIRDSIQNITGVDITDIRQIGELFKWLADRVVELKDKAVDSFPSFVEHVKNAANALKTGEPLSGFNIDPITEKALKIREFFIEAWNKVKEVYAIVKEKLTPVIETFGAAIRSLFKDVTITDIFKTGFLAGLFKPIKALIEGITNMFSGLGDGFKGLGSGIKNTLESVRNVLKSYQKELNANTLLKIAGSVAMLAGSIWLLSTIEEGKALYGIAAVSALLGEVVGVLKIINNMKLDPSKAGSFALSAGAIISISIAVSILAGALRKLKDFKTFDDTLPALIAIVSMMGAMVGAFALLTTSIKKNNVDGFNFIKISAGMLIIAFAIQKLAKSLVTTAKAVEIFGKMDDTSLIRGISAITTIIIEMAVFAKSIDQSNVATIAGVLLSFSFALTIITHAVKSFGSMDPTALYIGLGAVSALIIMLTYALKSLKNVTEEGNMKTDMIGVAGSLLAVAAALTLLCIPIKVLGNMEFGKLAKGIAGMAVSLYIIVKALKSIKKANGDLNNSAKAIMTMAAALLVLSVPLMLLSAIPFAALMGSLLGITVALGVFIGAAYAMAPLNGKLDGMAKTFMSFSAACLAVALSIGAVSFALITLSTIGAAGIAAVIGAVYLLLKGLRLLLPEIGLLVQDAVNVVLKIIYNSTDAIVDTALKLLVNVLTALAEQAEPISKSCMDIIVKVLRSISERLPELLPIVYEIISQLIDVFTSPFSTGNMLTALFTTDIFLCIVKDLKQIKKNAKDAIVGAGVMVLVFGMIAGVIYLAAQIPLDQMLAIAGTLTGVVVILTGVLFVLSKIPVSGAVTALEGFAIFIGGLVAILAILGGLNQIPGFSWLMDEGIKVMAQIGTALGALVGGIIGGIGLGMSNSLPAIGDNLTKFMENSEGFLSRLENLDDSVLKNAKAFAETIIILTAAELMNSVSNFLSGGLGDLYYVQLGDRLEKFGDGINRFVNAVGDVDSDTVQKAADAGLVMANLAKEIPSSGTSVLSIIMGNKDLGVFGEQLEKFGEGLKKFSDSIKGINTNVVENAASASMTLAELARSIPNNGDSILKWVIGEKNLENFGYQLSMFGASLMLFQDSVADLQPGVVEKAATAGTLLSDLANSIPTQGGAFNDWFFGNKDMSVFGAQLAAFGGGIRDFVSAIAMPTYTEDIIDGTYFSTLANIDEAVDAAEAILTIGAKVQELAPKDDSGIFDFVPAFSALNSLVEAAAQEANLNNLKTLGGVIKDFSLSLEGARMDLLNDSVPALNALGEILALLPNISFTNLEGISIEGFDDLGTQIISFYYNIAGMDFSVLTRGNSIFKKFIELLNELTGVNFTSISDLNYVIQQVCQMCEDIGASAAQFDLKVQNVTGDQLAEDVQKVIDMIGPLGQLSLKLRYIDLSGFERVTDEEGSSLFGRLGADLASFANNMVTFCASMEGIAGDVVQNYIGELNQIVTSMKTLSENAKTNVDWSGMQEFSDSLVSLGTEGIKGLIDTLSGVDSKNDLHDAVIALFANGKQGIEDSKEPLRSATSSVISGCVEEIKSRGNDFNNAAKELMKKVVTGIRTYAGPVKEAIRELISGARERAMSMANTFTSVGSRMASAIGAGFLNEIESVKAQIESEIEELSNIASTGVSVSTTQSYPETPYRGPSSNNNRSSITPVKTSGSRGLKPGMRSNQVMSMSNSAHLARTISVGMSKESTTQNQNGNGGSGNTYTFTQNNYSPKALSRTDIYRQTQNQFAVMKGTV